VKPETDKVRAPNIRDVAALAGVSYQTVSRVLNDSPSIRPATRQRVLDVIEQIGYRPNQAARALVTSRSRAIGVLTLQNVHFGPQTMVNAIELEARAAGYRLSIASTTRADDDVRASVDLLTNQAVEAIIVIAPQRKFFDVLDQLDLGVPIVALDSTRRTTAHSLSVDQHAGARLATRHLIDLGHKHIVHVANGAAKASEYSCSPSSSRAMIGITVVTASDSKAAMPISATMPRVASRYRRERTPPSRSAEGATVLMRPA
jgi:DNA-binding LacI/PurR family transcriptional regulator